MKKILLASAAVLALGIAVGIGGRYAAPAGDAGQGAALYRAAL